MKFNRGVALGTSLVLVLAACGDSSSSSRSRNAVALPCFESVDALTLAVAPHFNKYNETLAKYSAATKKVTEVTAADKVIRETIPPELLAAEKDVNDLKAAGKSVVTAQQTYWYWLAIRSSELLDSRTQLAVATADETALLTAMNESKELYLSYEKATICPRTLSAGDAEAGAAEKSASTASTSPVQFQFEDEPLSGVPIIPEGDSEVSGAGTADETSTSTSTSTTRPVYQFDDTPPATASVLPKFNFVEGEPLPPLQEVPQPPESTPTIPAPGSSEPQTIVNITIPNKINDEILDNIINIYNNTTSNTTKNTSSNETQSTVANTIVDPICYVDNKPLPMTITTIPNKINDEILDNNIMISNNNQIVTIIRIPKVITDNPLDQSSSSSSTPASKSETVEQSVYVSLAGFEKNAPVTVSIAETNTPIATFVTDKDGRIFEEVVIPGSVQTASVSLVVAGTNNEQQSVVMPVPLALSVAKSSAPAENSDESSSSIATADSVMSDTTLTADTSTMVDDSVVVSDDSSSTNIFGYWWVLLMILVLILSIFRFKSYKKVDDESSVRDI